MKEKLFKYRIIVITIILILAIVLPTYIIKRKNRDIDWSFADGTLTISGEGEMFNYGSKKERRSPWYEIKDEITKVVVEDGITRIGSSAFIYCNNLKEAYIGKDVDTINPYAFYGCKSLTKVVYKDKKPENVASSTFGYIPNEIEEIVIK